MEYKPLTIDADALAKQELHRLETAYVKSGGRMPRGAFKRMVEVRKFVEPEFPAEKALESRDREDADKLD